jgi:prohibitin 2
MSRAAKDAMKKMSDAARQGGSGGGPSPLLGALLRVTGLTAGAAYLGYSSLYDVQPGHVAVLYSRISGIKDQTVEPGTHFLIPFIERPIIFDIRKRPRNIHSLTGSKDLQMVNLNLRVLTRPRVSALPQMYEKLGLDYDDRVLPSIVNEVCKMVVAQYNATQLLTQREQVSRRIKESLVERAQEFDIIMDDVALTELKFSAEFRGAVEAKQVAQQDAERSKYIVEKALEEKRSIVITAQGQARAAELISSAMKDDPGFIELRRLEVAKEVAQTIARSRNRVFLNADSLLLNLLERVDGSSKHTK